MLVWPLPFLDATHTRVNLLDISLCRVDRLDHLFILKVVAEICGICILEGGIFLLFHDSRERKINYSMTQRNFLLEILIY